MVEYALRTNASRDFVAMIAEEVGMRGYALGVFEKNDALFLVNDVLEDDIVHLRDYEEQLASDSRYIANPKTVVVASESASSVGRAPAQAFVSTLGDRLRSGLDDIAGGLSRKGYETHLYEITERMDARGEVTSVSLRTIP